MPQTTSPNDFPNSGGFNRSTELKWFNKREIAIPFFYGTFKTLFSVSSVQLSSSDNTGCSTFITWDTISWASARASSFSSAAYKIFFIATDICKKFKRKISMSIVLYLLGYPRHHKRKRIDDIIETALLYSNMLSIHHTV